jgi:cysteine desulfurase/selenocysteine lyase
MTSESLKSVVTESELTALRNDFPILQQSVYGKPLIYFDNAATSQKPKQVIHTLTDFYTRYNANIHRGVHYLSQQASELYERVRIKVRDFIHARSEFEIIFTRGTTESINLAAHSFGNQFVNEGDEIIISAMEHHSNIVPWQLLCERKKAVLRIIPMNDNGELMMDAFYSLLSDKTRLVSVVHISNSLGTVNPVKEIVKAAHQRNIPVLIDAAQSAVHEEINVTELDCDFLAMSSHKMLGPAGAGVLYGKTEWLERMTPFQGGGDMIELVSFEKTTYREPPFRFEAGTQSIADVIAFGAALDYIRSLDRKKWKQYETQLLHYATHALSQIDGIRIIGTAGKKASILSFIVEGINAMDLGMYLDTQGIAVRTGQHCTEPVMEFFKIPGTLRASFLFYNTRSEVDEFVKALKRGISLLNPK